MKLSYPVALAVIIAVSCGTSTNFGQKPTDAKAATIWYSEQFTIYSKAVGRDFLIQVGEQYSMVKNAQELAARLKDHASSADVTLTEFEGQTHGTAIPECLSHGIQFMLPAPPASAGH